MDKEYFLEKKNGSRLKPNSLYNENPELYNIINNFAKENNLNMDFKEIVYLYVNNIKNKPKCKICDNDVIFERFSSGYRTYCSAKCKSTDVEIKNKVKDTFIKKYGGHPMKNDIIKNKVKQTNIERYGHESHLSSEKIKTKIETTNIVRYGVRRPLESKNILDKTKKTMLELYNVEHGLQSENIRKKTKISKYKNFDLKSILEKIKKTKKERYGDENFNNTQKSKKTNIFKYGVDNVFKFKGIREKITKTKLYTAINKYKHGSSIKLLEYGENFCKIKCDICDNESEMNRHFFTMRGVNGKIICTHCNPYGNIYSSSEKEIEHFLKDLEYIKNERNILSGLELDFYLPNYNLAIEYNGLYWHSEVFKEKKYHLNKTIGCNNNNIDLIHIFEDEWLYKPEIVKSIINTKLDINVNKIYGRKCSIKIIDNKEAKPFLNNNHIQGKINSKVNIGLYYNEELVSLMTFGYKRISLGSKHKKNEWELLRFCNKLNTKVVGGASKLFKFFINEYKPSNILYYSDNRYFNGNMYQQLGFEFVSNTVPNYFYVIKDKRYHRYNFRKDKLIKEGFNPNKTEKEIMLERKIHRIYDCGNKKWLWNNN